MSRPFGALLVAVSCAAAALLATRREAPPVRGPTIDPPGEYVSSAACLSCHPSEHASFTRTFHRTMTQRATARTILAPLAPGPAPGPSRSPTSAVSFEDHGGEIVAHADGREQRLVLTTGSHHYQTYWTEEGRVGELTAFSYVWLVAERRFIPRRDAFLQPPDATAVDVHWSSNCIQCHAVAGEPRRRGDTFDPRVAELGIACEACHGPGGEHVARHRDPIDRYLAHREDRPDPSIVNPARLDADRASEVCGQCHAYAVPRDEGEWWAHGYRTTYRPGGELAASRTLLTLSELSSAFGARIEGAGGGIFFSDGTVRVGGREWNGLALSACRTRGEGRRRISCLSCHSMHDSDPDDQLAHRAPGDAACVGCHEDRRGPAHTHHGEGSAGASCLACHMPKTSYALLGAIRSHRIDVPRVATAKETGRPLACNLCHADQTLAWSQEHLVAWYGAKSVALDPREENVAEVVDLALRGDAAVRAICAASLGEPDAIRASGVSWQAPILNELAADPYAAVRAIAGRSLGAIRSAEGSPSAAREALEEARAKRLLLTPRGEADRARFDEALGMRDTRPVTISE